MHKILPIFISAVCGLTFVPMIIALPLIAHQSRMTTTSSDGVEAMIHVDPDDTPLAGQDSQTWFMLSQTNGRMISLERCNCQVMVYNASNEPIADDLSLSTLSVQGHDVISTTINFPAPGPYTVVLSGTAKDESFAPFELEFPITAVNP